ncbi:MAG TPA: hypothetical protein VMM38_03470 [Aridibacter sp.]|nr:hypothetical protein [Aridibacter sp.]
MLTDKTVEVSYNKLNTDCANTNAPLTRIFRISEPPGLEIPDR